MAKNGVVVRWLAIVFGGLVLSVALMQSAVADEKLPKQMQVGERRLVLNGEGVRTKAFLELYMAGLYLDKTNANPAAIIAADEPMAIRIKITSGFVSQSSLVDSLEDGFKNGTGGKDQLIRKEIAQFREFFRDEIKKGDVFDMVYLPEHGVIVNKNGKLMGAIPGIKFKQALFSIWLSDKPADSSLKAALLTSPKLR